MSTPFRWIFFRAFLPCLALAGSAPQTTHYLQVRGRMLMGMQISLTDGVAATSGGSACINVSATSVLASSGTTGTSTLGSYDMLFSTGTPSGAQGCPSPTSSYSVQTFSLSLTTDRAGQVNASINAGGTWDSVKFASGDGNDWTSDSTGVTLTTSGQTVISGLSAGTISQNIQLAWGALYTSASGSKSATINLTLFEP